jgi:hypothetical protein
MLPLVCAALGLIVLLACARSVQREIGPTTGATRRFGRETRAALVRVRSETARTRRRYDG